MASANQIIQHPNFVLKPLNNSFQAASESAVTGIVSPQPAAVKLQSYDRNAIHNPIFSLFNGTPGRASNV